MDMRFPGQSTLSKVERSSDSPYETCYQVMPDIFNIVFYACRLWVMHAHKYEFTASIIPV